MNNFFMLVDTEREALIQTSARIGAASVLLPLVFATVGDAEAYMHAHDDEGTWAVIVDTFHAWEPDN